MEKVCKASIKNYFLVLIILFSSFTCSFAYYPTEEEVIISFGVPAYINDCAFGFGKDDLTKCAYIGEPRPIIKCYQKNGQRICRKTRIRRGSCEGCGGDRGTDRRGSR